MKPDRWSGFTMMLLLVLSFCVGILLGLRFTFFVLIPAIVLTVSFVTAAKLAGAMDVQWTLAVVCALAILQVGYLVGASLRTLHVRGSMSLHRGPTVVRPSPR